jgi:hypothetical protein
VRLYPIQKELMSRIDSGPFYWMFLKKLFQIRYSAKHVKVHMERLLKITWLYLLFQQFHHFSFLLQLSSFQLFITFLFLEPSHHKMIKECPIFLRENQCCVGGMNFITMVGQFRHDASCSVLSFFLYPFLPLVNVYL